MPVDISIIIVSFNTKDILKDCLESLFKSKTKITYEVIIVDNHSTDGSPEMVKKEFPQVHLIKNVDNVGFGKANNHAAQHAQGKYLWLLNSDTIIKSDTLDTLFQLAEQHHSYLASCTLANADGSYQPHGGALPNLANVCSWMTNLDSIPLVAKLIPPYQDRHVIKHTSDVLQATYGWVGGTAMLIRRDLFMGLGGFDEHIFMYGEDVELCWRVTEGNLPIHMYPTVSIVHLANKSGSSEASILGEFKGLKYIFKKHRGRGVYTLLRFLLKLGALARLIMYTVLRNQQRKIYAKAFTMA